MASCFVRVGARVSLHDEPPPPPTLTLETVDTWPTRLRVDATARSPFTLSTRGTRAAAALSENQGVVAMCIFTITAVRTSQLYRVTACASEIAFMCVCVCVCACVRAGGRVCVCVCATHARRGEDAGNLGKTYTTSSQIALSRESCAARETSRAARLQGASVCAQRQRACTAKACVHSSFQRGFMAYSRFHFRAWSRAACSLLFHCSAASLFRGSSGFGADMSA